jgi:hypothetical protein
MTDPIYKSTADTGGSATDQVNDQVRDKAQLAQDKTRGAFGQARGRLRGQVDQRSTQAGDQVQSAAQDVRKVAEQLRGQGKETPARVAEQVADRAESFSSYLRDADGERLLGDVEAFARRQPWLVAAGGLALGFAASRFLKASSSRRYQAGSDHGTETPFSQADVVAPVAGSDAPASQPMTQATEPSNPTAAAATSTRRSDVGR